MERAKRLERQDAEISAQDFLTDMGLFRVRWRRLVTEAAISPIVDRMGRRILRSHTRDYERVLGLSLADDTPAVQGAMAEFRRQNVALIKTIPERLHRDVTRTVLEASTRGTRAETLQRQIRERFQVSESRARLIARDQVLKAHGNLSQIRNREAGIERYQWSTSRDERVRPEHEELDGQIFSWDAPPPVGHPGEDIQCRCAAVPLLPA